MKLLTCKKELIDEVIDKAFKMQNLEQKNLKRKVVLKDGEKEEFFDEKRFKEELRPELESFIADLLGL